MFQTLRVKTESSPINVVNALREMQLPKNQNRVKLPAIQTSKAEAIAEMTQPSRKQTRSPSPEPEYLKD